MIKGSTTLIILQHNYVLIMNIFLMLLIFLMFITLKRLTPIGEALFVGGGRREGTCFTH